MYSIIMSEECRFLLSIYVSCFQSSTSSGLTIDCFKHETHPSKSHNAITYYFQLISNFQSQILALNIYPLSCVCLHGSITSKATFNISSVYLVKKKLEITF